MSNEQRPESFDERFRRRSHSFENDDFEKDNTDEVADTESGVETETFSSKMIITLNREKRETVGVYHLFYYH